MAVNYITSVKDARMDVVGAALNVSGGGLIQLQTAGTTPLVNINLDTVIGASVAGVLTCIGIDAPILGTATAAGTAALAVLKDGADVTIVTGLTVGLAAADVILNDLDLISGSQVTMNSGTITSG